MLLVSTTTAALTPPDPVVVDAVAEPTGIPQRITITLRPEGLFNDTAGIVTFTWHWLPWSLALVCLGPRF